jgi:hypothetical protein
MSAWMIVPSTQIGIENTNRSDFDRFVALAGERPVIDGVRVNVAWASAKAPS